MQPRDNGAGWVYAGLMAPYRVCRLLDWSRGHWLIPLSGCLVTALPHIIAPALIDIDDARDAGLGAGGGEHVRAGDGRRASAQTRRDESLWRRSLAKDLAGAVLWRAYKVRVGRDLTDELQFPSHYVNEQNQLQ